MVTISPGPPIWADIVRLGWKLNDRLVATPLGTRRIPVGDIKTGIDLDKLSMIGFARWSMIDRIPTGVPKDQATPLPRPFLMFETNFNGDHDAYFEAFAFVVPKPMNRMWDHAYDVPPVERTSEWQRVINERKERNAFYYYSAYRDASTKMVRTALRLTELLDEFRPRAAGMTDAQFDFEFRTLAGKVSRINDPRLPQGGGETGSLTTIIPVEHGRRNQLQDCLQELLSQPAELPATTHFARWCVVKQLHMPPRFGIDPNSYLLFSAWFDGEPETYAATLYERLGADLVESIWSNCGFEGGSAEAFADYLMKYCVPYDAKFQGYAGVPVREVTPALGLAQHFDGFVRDAQGMRGPALRAAWNGRPGAQRRAVNRPQDVDQREVQGNILCGYGNSFAHAVYLFIRFGKDAQGAREWLRRAGPLRHDSRALAPAPQQARGDAQHRVHPSRPEAARAAQVGAQDVPRRLPRRHVETPPVARRQRCERSGALGARRCASRTRS